MDANSSTETRKNCHACVDDSFSVSSTMQGRFSSSRNRQRFFAVRNPLKGREGWTVLSVERAPLQRTSLRGTPVPSSSRAAHVPNSLLATTIGAQDSDTNEASIRRRRDVNSPWCLSGGRFMCGVLESRHWMECVWLWMNVMLSFAWFCGVDLLIHRTYL